MPWYRSRKLLLVMGAYGAVSFLWNFVEELTPMFASTPYKQVCCSMLLASLTCKHACCQRLQWLGPQEGQL
jgi:hypothetical protein